MYYMYYIKHLMSDSAHTKSGFKQIQSVDSWLTAATTVFRGYTGYFLLFHLCTAHKRESTEASSGSLCKPSALVLPVKTGDGAQERTLLSWYPASFENFPRSSKILDGSLAYACSSGCFNATEPYLEEVFLSRSLSPNGGTSVGLWWASSCSACTSTQGTKITLQHSHGKGDSSPGRMHPYLPT